MLIDQAKIYVQAGKGGDGAVSFRREKYVPKGGPDGGDGGDGGDVIIETDPHSHGLALFNSQKKFKAKDGQNGMGSKKSGKSGDDLIIKMPPGTQIYFNKKLLADLALKGKRNIIAKGGRGGWGNHHFATSIKQAPKWSKKGLLGEELVLNLELKLIADVGLIGLPNAGKSTLLSVLSNAKPKIANYPFTTLEPNLGTIKNIDRNIILADIPGLIAGASAGKGLGDKFLKHIERTKIFVHIIDANSEDFKNDYKVIRNELGNFSSALLQKKEIVVISKTDTIEEKNIKKKLKPFLSENQKPILISAATHKNIDLLINRIKKELIL